MAQIGGELPAALDQSRSTAATLQTSLKINNIMTRTRAMRFLICAGSILCLAACGGNGEKSIGGDLSGLNSGASVTLQNNGTDNLTLTANGSFQFASDLQGGTAYNVTILSQPIGQSCTVSNASGTLDAAADPVQNVAVDCTGTSNVVGTVLGLAPGTSVTLSDGSEQLPIASNGAFAFSAALAVGASYSVVVVVQPASETCVVANGAGTVVANVVNNVTVTCS